MGNQSKMILSNQLDKIINDEHYIPSNNSIDLLDDIFEEDYTDIGLDIDEQTKEKYWLLPFHMYL